MASADGLRDSTVTRRIRHDSTLRTTRRCNIRDGPATCPYYGTTGNRRRLKRVETEKKEGKNINTQRRCNVFMQNTAANSPTNSHGALSSAKAHSCLPLTCSHRYLKVWKYNSESVEQLNPWDAPMKTHPYGTTAKHQVSCQFHRESHALVLFHGTLLSNPMSCGVVNVQFNRQTPLNVCLAN